MFWSDEAKNLAAKVPTTTIVAVRKGEEYLQWVNKNRRRRAGTFVVDDIIRDLK